MCPPRIALPTPASIPPAYDIPGQAGIESTTATECFPGCVLGGGQELHLHVIARGDYDTGVFAYGIIRRGERYGLRIVLKSQLALAEAASTAAYGRMEAQQDYQHYGTAVEAGEISGWTVIVELSGYQATLPVLLQALSEGGEAVVIYQNVNGLAS